MSAVSAKAVPPTVDVQPACSNLFSDVNLPHKDDASLPAPPAALIQQEILCKEAFMGKSDPSSPRREREARAGSSRTELLVETVRDGQLNLVSPVGRPVVLGTEKVLISSEDSYRPAQVEVSLTKVPKAAWIISDANSADALSSALRLMSIEPTKVFLVEDLKSHSKHSKILKEFEHDLPDILWVNVPNDVHKWSGDNSKRLAVMLSVMFKRQLQSDRNLIVEGCIASARGWHPKQFTSIIDHARLKASAVRWCALNIKDSKDLPVCHYSRIVSTVPIPALITFCNKHDNSSNLRNFPSNMGEEYHYKLVEVLFSGLVKKKVKVKERVTLDEDEPGEHADSQGLGPQVKSVLKTSKDVEDVYDDCGDNCDPITLAESFAMFDSASTADSDNTCLDCVDDFDSEFYSWAMPGSCPREEDLSQRPFSVHHYDMKSMLVALDESPGIHDVAELFGGEGNVIKLSIRRKLVGGSNMDVTTGINLMEAEHVAALWVYLRTHKPRVVVAGPPCTSFGNWSHLNRKRNPAAFFESRRIGKRLANLTAAVCNYQISVGNHFLVENPRDSEMWLLPMYALLRQSPEVCEVILDQCTVGLCDPDGHLTRKSTLLIASHPCLIKRLARRCQNDHPHVQLAGSTQGVSRCKYAQAWPRRMVELIVEGIQELLSLIQAKAYPVAATCRGCRSNAAKHDPRHDRGDGCRYPLEATITWNCPACKQYRSSGHSGHSFELTDCQWAEAKTRQHAGRQPRDPRVPARSVVEAPADIPDPVIPPKIGGKDWVTVTNLETVTWLDQVRGRDGWHSAPGNMTLVITNARAFRSCEPRLDSAKWKWRSTFALWPGCAHRHGLWWQIEDTVAFTQPAFSVNMPFDLPVLL